MKFENLLIPILFTMSLIVLVFSCDTSKPVVVDPTPIDTTSIDTTVVDTIVIDTIVKDTGTTVVEPVDPGPIVDPLDSLDWSDFAYEPTDSLYRWQSALLNTDTSSVQYFRFEVLKAGYERVPIGAPLNYTNWVEGQTDALYQL